MASDSPPQPPDESPEVSLRLPLERQGQRLDLVLVGLLPSCSRSHLARLLKDGAILVDGQQAKPNRKVRGGEEVCIEWPEPETIEALPEAIPLSVLYEDSHIVVVDKPAGMAVHPSPGHARGTLVNALLAHCKDLSSINGALRPGIVHRLDLDTSGVIVSAKNDQAHRHLQEQFAGRTVHKQYLALCRGRPAAERFESAGRIGRHPLRRTEMTVLKRPGEGREAFTAFEVQERYARLPSSGSEEAGGGGGFLVLARPRTGRTHQIRVHLAKAGYPILCDRLYGRETEWPALGLRRHALHAWRIEFRHPASGEPLQLEAPWPQDLAGAIGILRAGGA